jgi:hypothetical protein
VYETYDCRFILRLKCNQALWRARGVTAGRHSQIKCSIPNPIYVDEQVSLFADVPHLFKNIKAMLVPNKVITLPDNIVSQHSLPTNEVRVSHINELVAHQEKHGTKIKRERPISWPFFANEGYDQKLASDSTGLSGGFSGQRAWVRKWAPGSLFELVVKLVQLPGLVL